MKKWKKKHKDDDPAELAFVGCILLGLGTGLFYGRPDVGVLVGLGIGFLIMAFVKLKTKKWKIK